MSSDQSDAVAEARRDLGARLRQIRRSAGLTGRALAALCGIHHTRLSRLEHGHQVPTEQNVRDWCRHCGMSALIPELVATLHAVDTAYVEWRTRVHGGMKNAGGPGVKRLYQETSVFRIHEPLIVPGLFQTEPYLRGVLSCLYQLHGAPDDVEETVSFRLRRAAVALRGGKRILVVMFEEGLRVRYCDRDGHERQLAHLLEVTRLPYVSFGVVPMSARRYGVSAAGFWMFDDRLVPLGIPSAEIKITRPQEIQLYQRLFAALQQRAVYGRPARSLIARALSEA